MSQADLCPPTGDHQAENNPTTTIQKEMINTHKGKIYSGEKKLQISPALFWRSLTPPGQDALR